MWRILLKYQIKLNKEKMWFFTIACSISMLFSSVMINFSIGELLTGQNITGISALDGILETIIVVLSFPLHVFLVSEQAIFTINLAVFGVFLCYIYFKIYYRQRKDDICTLIARGLTSRVSYYMLTFTQTLISILGIITGYLIGTMLSATFWIFYRVNENPDYILYHPEDIFELFYDFPFATSGGIWPLYLIAGSFLYLASILILMLVTLLFTSYIAYRSISKEIITEEKVNPEDYGHLYTENKSSIKLKGFVFFMSLLMIGGMSLSTIKAVDIPFLYILLLLSYMIFTYSLAYALVDLILLTPYLIQKVASSRFLIVSALFVFAYLIISASNFIPSELYAGKTYLWIPAEFIYIIIVFTVLYLLVFLIDSRFIIIPRVTKITHSINCRFSRYLTTKIPFNVFLIIGLTLSLAFTSALAYKISMEENLGEAFYLTGSDIKMDLNSDRLFNIVPMNHLDIITSHENVEAVTRVYVHKYYYLGAPQGVATTELIFINVSDYRDVVMLKDENFVGATADELFQQLTDDNESVILDINKANDIGIRVGDQIQFVTNFGQSFQVTVIGLAKEFPTGYTVEDNPPNAEYRQSVYSFAILNLELATRDVASAGFSSNSGFSTDPNWRPTTYYLIKTKKGIIRNDVAEEFLVNEDLGFFFWGTRYQSIDRILPLLEASHKSMNFQIFGTGSIVCLITGSTVFVLSMISGYDKKKHKIINLLPMIVLSLALSLIISSIILILLDFQFLPATILGNELIRDMRTINNGIAGLITVTISLIAVGALISSFRTIKMYRSKVRST